MSDPDVISDWMAFAELLRDSVDNDWIFRGENCINNELRPKAGRTSSPALRALYSEDAEKQTLQSFKRQARPYLTHTPLSDFEWMAIAQHHGMSTRLLDWSESLLVAAYFASADAGAKGSARIYGLKELIWVEDAANEDPFDLNIEVKGYRPPHISPRIPAQRSVFTVHRNPRESFYHLELKEWELTADCCREMKKILDACAINEASLFPDVDGLSRYLGWRYKWGKS